MEKQKMNLENDMESIICRLHERRKQDGRKKNNIKKIKI